MPTTIIIRRGTAAPTQASGLSLGEPAFNTTDQTFHIGRGAGITAAWIGARISGLSSDIDAGLTLQIPNLAAVKNYVTNYVATNTSGVASLNSLTGTLSLLGGSNIGISAASGSITVTNNGVRTLGLSGDWKKSVVAIFGGSIGALLISGATWGSASVTNAGNVGGIANGTDLSGKTVFEILENLLFSYQTVTLSAVSMSGSYTTGNLELGQTAASAGSRNFGWTANNPTNIDANGMTVVYSGYASGSIIGGTAYGSGAGANANRAGTIPNAMATTIGNSFTITVQASQSTAYAAAGSPGTTSGATASRSIGTATWYSKMYMGYTTGTSITNRNQLVTTGMASDRMITSTGTGLQFNTTGTSLSFSPGSGGGAGNKYLYILIHDYYNSLSNWKLNSTEGFDIPFTGYASGATLSVTNDQGFTTVYKIYRSTESYSTPVYVYHP